MNVRYNYHLRNIKMASKLLSLIISKQIPKLASSISSISCATHFPNPPETHHHNSINSPEFSVKIRQLKNKLNPETLIQTLDSTQDLNSSIQIFKWASHQTRFYHTADTYSYIISKLGLAGNLQEMENFCHEMLNEKCPNTENALSSLIASFVKNHRFMEALKVIEIMRIGNFTPCIQLCNLMIGRLLEERRDVQSIIFAYKEIVKAGVIPNVDTLNYLIEVLCDNDKIESALDQFKRMSKKGCCPNSRTFQILICCLCKRNRLDEPVRVLDEMFGLECSLDLDFYNAVIPLLCKANKPDEGMKLYRMVRESRFVPDSLVYESLTRCMSENLRFDDAIEILEEMVSAGLNPMVDMYVDVVSGLCKLSRYSDAANFLEKNSVSEVSAHNILLEGYCNGGNFREANDYLEMMVERNIVDTASWSILVRVLCKVGKIRKASEVLNRMLISSFVPDCAIYCALISGNCKECKYEEALELFRRTSVQGWILDSDVYSELIVCLCQFDLIQAAAEVFYDMASKECTISSSAFDFLIKEICLAGEVDKAIELYSLAQHIGISCNPATYSSIMISLYELGRIMDIIVLFSRMLLEGCAFNSETYHVLMHSMCTEKRVKECAQLLDRMVGEGMVPNSETLDRVLSLIASRSHLHTVIHTLNKLASENAISSLAMYNMLIQGLMMEGHKGGACKLLDHMLDNGWVPGAVTHSLLVSSIDGKAYRMQDNVSSILVEGFEAT